MGAYLKGAYLKGVFQRGQLEDLGHAPSHLNSRRNRMWNILKIEFFVPAAEDGLTELAKTVISDGKREVYTGSF